VTPVTLQPCAVCGRALLVEMRRDNSRPKTRRTMHQECAEKHARELDRDRKRRIVAGKKGTPCAT